MKFSGILLIAIIISSCTTGIETKAVDLTPFFCDNSSKVWMVNNFNLKNPELEVAKIDFREVFVFYKSGRVIVQPLNSLGNQEYEKANYSIDSEMKTLEINFEESNAQWLFKIEHIHPSKVILTPINSEFITKDLEIIPLPEL